MRKPFRVVAVGADGRHRIAAGRGLALPDADGAGAAIDVAVTGLAGRNVEAVVLDLSANHFDALELGVTLRSPAGTASVINPPFNAALGGRSGFEDWHLLSNAFYGEHDAQ